MDAECFPSTKNSEEPQFVIEYHHHLVKRADELDHLIGLLRDEGYNYRVVSGDEVEVLMIYAWRV